MAIPTNNNTAPNPLSKTVIDEDPETGIALPVDASVVSLPDATTNAVVSV